MKARMNVKMESFKDGMKHFILKEREKSKAIARDRCQNLISLF